MTYVFIGASITNKSRGHSSTIFHLVAAFNFGLLANRSSISYSKVVVIGTF